MKHFSPQADATLAYSSELLTIDAATVIGLRASRRLARRIPRGSPIARVQMVRAILEALVRCRDAMLGGGRWGA